MANAPLGNAANRPLNVQTGTVPNVNAAMLDWFQPMVFTRVVKTIEAFQNVETAEDIKFRGVIQPLSPRDLLIKPEGQRAWTWHMLHADPSLTLQVDEVVIYLGVQTRIMARRDYTIYGYVQYDLVQDWTGAGPNYPPTGVIDGGGAGSVPDNDVNAGEPGGDVNSNVDGGNSGGG